MTGKERAKKNRTLTLTDVEYRRLKKQLASQICPGIEASIDNKIYCGILERYVSEFPKAAIDLLIIDPPYNINKNYHGNKFSECSEESYASYLSAWFESLLPLLKQTASVYVCCDWKSSNVIFSLLNKYLIVRNRITWQREKGRGAQNNWKNCMEDIWFATVSDNYYFDAEAVKQKRRVLAPYRDNGVPKDWNEEDGGKFRLTAPSNFWDDISIPFWSMPENTDHPTQKPEKLIAKLILASSKTGDMVFDPFLGSGTTAVVAKKLGRRFCGVEQNEEYCVWAMKRLEIADKDTTIQGYVDQVFWERNTLNEQMKSVKTDIKI
ncbi:MAG: site-specific DNA-methyltransferase [Negativicutes bacterium]|jgi:site-specific DNA-methyltransferase (adenine-specific)